MRTDKLMEHISNIDDRLVQQAGDIPNFGKRYRRNRVKRVVLIAAITVLVVSSFAVGALAANSGVLRDTIDNNQLHILQDHELSLEIREIIASAFNVQDSFVSVRLNTLKGKDDVTARPAASIALSLNKNTDRLSDCEAEEIFQLLINHIPGISRANIFIVDNNLNSYYGDISGRSVEFSSDEIDAAMNLVKNHFDNEIGWRGCEMLDLWYDEEQYRNALKSYMMHGRGSVNGVLAENVIIIFSDIYVGTSGIHPVFEPGDTYFYNWGWILIRDDKDSPWRIDDMGVM
jgi:hypothetical protein